MTEPRWSRLVSPLRAAVRSPMIVALVAAGGIATLLALAVLAPWAASSDDATRTARELAAAIPTVTPSGPTPSPTPRVVRPRTPTPAPSGAEAAATTTPAAVPTTAAPPTRPPQPRPTITPRPAPTPPPTPIPTESALYEASGAQELAAFNGPSWGFANEMLINDGSTIEPQPWITIPYRPEGGDYAIEAEIRIKGITEGVFCQNFGLVTGVGASGAVWGGGVIFACEGVPPRVRISDASDWSDGFWADRALTTEAFDPGTTWHTYRLEVRDRRLRLLIDGEPLIQAMDAVADAQPGAGDGQLGLWSEGVRLSVRRIAVLPL